MAEWRIIEGYRNPYRISTDRKIERMNKGAEWIPMNIRKHPQGSDIVTFYDREGRPKTMSVNQLMHQAFGDEYKHIPQVKTRPVEMVDRYGKVIATYHSMIEAANANYMCIQSVRNRCKGRVQYPFTNYQYTFRYKE